MVDPLRRFHFRENHSFLILLFPKTKKLWLNWKNGRNPSINSQRNNLVKPKSIWMVSLFRIFLMRAFCSPWSVTNFYYSGDRSQVRRRETNLGSFLADAVADDLNINLVILNGGGIRGGIPIGNVSKPN